MGYSTLVLISPSIFKVVRYALLQPAALRTKLDHSWDCTIDGEELRALNLFGVSLNFYKTNWEKNPKPQRYLLRLNLPDIKNY